MQSKVTARLATAPKATRVVVKPDVETKAEKLARARRMLRGLTKEAEELLVSAKRTHDLFSSTRG